MIERATQCLHRVGKNAIASHEHGRQTRRSLHSLFWTHGASDIALPAWWNAFLQQSDPRLRRSNDTLYISPQSLRSSFLDFLYPPKALEHAARVAIRAARKHSTTRQKSTAVHGRQGRKKGLSRWYTTDGAKSDQQGPPLAAGLSGEDAKNIKTVVQKGDIDTLVAKADALFEQLNLLDIEARHQAPPREAKRNTTEVSHNRSSTVEESQALHKNQALTRDGTLESPKHKTATAPTTQREIHETSSGQHSASRISEASENATTSALDDIMHEAAAIVGSVASDTHRDREGNLVFWRGHSQELADAYDAYLRSIDIASAIPQGEDDFVSTFNFEVPVIRWQLQSTLQAGLAFLTLFIKHFYSRILPTDEALWTEKQWLFLIRTTMLYPKEGIAQIQALVSVGTNFPASIQGVFDLLNRAFTRGHGLEPAREVLRLALQRGQIHFVNALLRFCNGKGLTPSKLLTGLATVETPLLVQHILGCVRNIEKTMPIGTRKDLYYLNRRNRQAYLSVIHQLVLQLLQRPLSSDVVAASYEEIWTLLSDHKYLVDKDIIQLLDQLVGVRSSNAADTSVFLCLAYKVFATARQQPSFAWSEPQVKTFLQKMITVHHPHCGEVFEYYRSQFGYDSETFKTILPELSYSGEAEKWQDIFKEVGSKEELDKSDWIYQLLEAYSRRADTAMCNSLLESTRKEVGHNLDIQSWNAVLNSYVQGSNMVGALAFRKYLDQEGIVPNDTTNMIILRGFASRGESALALKEVKQIQSRGHELTMEMVKHLMHAHIVEGNIDRAEQLLYDSTSTNVLGPKTEAWNRILEAFANMGRLADLNYLRSVMNEQGIPADAATYGALMLGFCMAGLPNQASRVLSTIMPSNNMAPTIRHYNILIAGFVRKEMFDEAIKVYQKAKNEHIKPDAVTRNLIIQANSSTCGDLKKGDAKWNSVKHQALASAEAFLHKSLEEDGYHHAVSPSGKMGTSGTPLDQAYASLHFGFLIQQYAHLGEQSQMDNLLQQYRQFYEKEYPHQELMEPPKVLAAIGQYYLKTNNTNGITKLWDKALQSLEPLVAKTGADTTEPGWVLQSRSLMIAPIFRIRMIDLMRRKQHEELEELTRSLITAGWRFPESIWNLYIRFLAMEGHHVMALKYCEEYLIAGFPGWPAKTKYGDDSNKVIEKHTPGALNTGIMKPTYEVLCWLAKNYIDFQQKHAYSPQRIQLESELWDMAPRTLKAVTTMPRVSDLTQGKILRGEQRGRGIGSLR